jgi:O-antigen/teichoic acid export membrane protein
VIHALLRDGSVYALGTIVTRGLGLLLLPLYTHALQPDEFGLLDLIVTVGVLVNLVVPLETPQAVARLWNERAQGIPRRRLAGTGAAFALAGYALFVVLAWMFAQPLAQALTGQVQDAPALRAGAAFVAANGLMLVVQGQFRWALRPRAFALASVGYSAMVLGGMAVLVADGAATVASVLWVQGAAAAAVAGVSSWVLRRDLDWRIDLNELGELLRYSLPLVLAGIAMFATLNLHRFVLNAMGSLDQVGLFGVASRLAGVGTLVLIGVQSALTPLIYAHHADPETPARLARLMEAFWALSLLASLVLSALGREALAVLATPAYGDAAFLVVWLAPAALMAQMYIFAPGIALAKKTMWQLVLTVASGVIGLLLSVLLVPLWQATGASVAACAGAAFFFGAWLLAGQRLYPLPLRWSRLAVATVAFGGLIVLNLRVMQWPPGTAAWLAKLGLLCALVAVLIGMGLLGQRLWRDGRPRLPRET